ncbi:cation transporter [bacterium]|nr:cation transporter [bacterium]
MDQENLRKTARLLSVFTVGYNLLEGLISIIVSILSGSAALLGFGVDSFVESISGGVMIWRFKKRPDLPKADEERIEQRAIQLVGFSFIILGCYVAFEAFKKLYLKDEPEATIIGIFISVASIIIMPALYFFKRRTAKALGSKSLTADSKQTLACVVLSFALLFGLGANYFFGLWWMDPVAAIFISFFLIKEGITTIKEKDLCCS